MKHLLATSLSALLCLSATQTTLGQAKEIFWTDGVEIYRSNVSDFGGSWSRVVSNFAPSDLVVDGDRGYLCWVNGEVGLGHVVRSRLDGTDAEHFMDVIGPSFVFARSVVVDPRDGLLYLAGGAAPGFADATWIASVDHDGGVSPLFDGWSVHGDFLLNAELMAFDPQDEKLYWRQWENDDRTFRRAGLWGQEMETILYQWEMGGQPQALALDVGARKLYASDHRSYDETIGAWRLIRAELDGTNRDTLLIPGPAPAPQRTGIEDLQVDSGAAKIYFCISRGDQCMRANLDGSGLENLGFGGHEIKLDTQNGKVYWITEDPVAVQRANLDGSEVETVVVEWMRPEAIAVEADKVYWTDSFSLSIRRADRDGSNVEEVVEPEGGGHDLAVSATKVYWQYDGSDRHWPIIRANLDGTEVEEVVPTSDPGAGFVLDNTNGLIYWAEAFPSGRPKTIRRSDLEGANVEVVLDRSETLQDDLDGILSLSVVANANELYWTEVDYDYSLGERLSTIFRAQLDGSVQQELLKRPDYSIRRLAIDHAGGKVYFTTAGNLERANLDGSEPETLQFGVDDFALSFVTGTDVDAAANLPSEFALSQNYPNPFNPTTTISYDLPEAADVTLTVYDLLGRAVRELASGTQPAGTYEVSFDATRLPSGIYFYRLTAGDYVETKRMVVVR